MTKIRHSTEKLNYFHLLKFQLALTSFLVYLWYNTGRYIRAVVSMLACSYTVIIPLPERETWLTHKPSYEKWLEDRFTKDFHYRIVQNFDGGKV